MSRASSPASRKAAAARTDATVGKAANEGDLQLDGWKLSVYTPQGYYNGSDDEEFCADGCL